MRVLIDLLHELYNNIGITGNMPESQRNAIIVLLFKKGDHRLLKNWRPVSLLNVDYKILSKIMTNRLSKVMSKLIPIEQKCGVQGRQMTDIIRNLDTISEDMNTTGGFLICLDQEKAFDRINHEYMFMILEKMGFSGRFLKTVSAMYNRITSQVNINGALTNKISIQRSIRQGCAFSMLLFVLVSVPLIEMIKDSKEISGYTTIRISNLEITKSKYKVTQTTILYL